MSSPQSQAKQLIQLPIRPAAPPSQPLYQRHRLNPARHEIRLLRITPGLRDDPIHCTLSVASLDDKPEFEALSYVWGDPSVTLPASVDEAELQITTNLLAALRQLRPSPGETRRLLWVDAICINQGSNAEKVSQIPLMERVYGEAADVIAWMGELDSSVEVLLGLVKALTREFGDYDEQETPQPLDLLAYWKTTLNTPACRSFVIRTVTHLAKNSPEIEQIMRASGSPSTNLVTIISCLTAWDGCYAVLANPYWKRLWTFQEYALPSSPPLSLYGHASICWLGPETFLLQPLEQLLGNLLQAMAQYLGRAGDYLAAMVMKSLIRERAQRYDATNYLEFFTRRYYNSRRSDDLAGLLLFTATCESWHPADRIYALHGLVPGLSAACPPDYSKDVATVVIEALAFEVERFASLMGLGLAFLSLERQRSEQDRPARYPSWLPASGDALGKSERTEPMHVPPSNRGHLTPSLLDSLKSQTRDFAPTISVDIHCLRTPVAMLVNRTAVCERLSGTMNQRWDRLCSNIKKLRAVEGLGTSEDVENKILRCLTAHNPNHTTLGSGPHVAQVVRMISSNLEDSTAASMQDFGTDRLVWLKAFVEDIVLFVVDDCILGVGHGVQDGDSICLLPDVPLPFAIRKERDDPELGPVWNMVGAVYIDGLFDNKGLDEALVEMAKKEPVEVLAFQ